MTTIFYPDGYSYRGNAVEEVMYFQVLKTYSFADAQNMMLSAIIQGAQNQGLTLLKTVLHSVDGVLYHEFTATTSYIPVQQLGNQINSLILPELVPLLIFAVEAVLIIIGLIIFYYILQQIKEIVYGPPGPGGIPSGGGISQGMLILGIVFLAMMMSRK